MIYIKIPKFIDHVLENPAALKHTRIMSLFSAGLCIYGVLAA